ncbi:MGA_1079 family surface serine endopeptidase [Mycoplasmopsis canis]|uniref:MGA_1079 family surface serine endopeptidase n=1 Tax=Mycoplasmopsis canis TaxID=29555 RepID=UPI00025AECA7|nr:hypothetical protein [Mycoplasmopsis canis]EIE40913.1 hypothetical protein MCANUF33_00453 [Mycoplasmopsis canis UF33]
MKKQIKNIFILTSGAVAIPMTALSCSIDNAHNVNQNNENTKELLQYFEKDDNKRYFKNIENNIKNNQNISLSPEQINTMISFFNEYKKINDLNIEQIYEGLEDNLLNSDFISNELKAFDKLINTNSSSFLEINNESVKRIQDIHNLILERNARVINKNSEYDLFIKEINNLSLSNNLIWKYLKNHSAEIFNDVKLKNEIFELVKSIDINYSILNNLKNLYKTKEEPEIKKIIDDIEVFLNNSLTNNSLVEFNPKANEYIEKLKNKVIEKDLISNDVKQKKNELTEKIRLSENIDEENKKSLLEKTKKIVSLAEIDNYNGLFKKLDSNIEAKKTEFIQFINDSALSDKNKEYFSEIIQGLEEAEFNDISTSFKKMMDKFERLQNKVNEIKEKISNNNFKSSYALEFYKKITKFVELFDNDNKLEKINLLYPDDNLKLISDIYVEIEKINIEEEFDIKPQEESVIDLFKKETASSFSLNTTENGALYDLEKYSYSASYNLKSAEILFDNFDTEEVDYKIVNLKLNESNWNNLIVTVKVSLKSNSEINYLIDISKAFSGDVTPQINSLNFNNLDQFFNINYDDLQKLSLEEFSNLSNDQKKEWFTTNQTRIGKFFKFELTNYEYVNRKVFADFSVLFNNQVIKKWRIPTIRNVNFVKNEEEKESYSDVVDKRRIMEIINGNISTLMTKVKFKEGAKHSHMNYIASDVKKAFDDLYIMPKYGRYEVFIKDYHHVSDYDGWVDIILWYKKDGKEVEIKNPADVYSKTKRLRSFKLISSGDIKPIGEIFTVEDFQSSEQPSQEFIDAINSINESNFGFRYAEAQNGQRNFRAVNVKDIIDQKAFSDIEYVLQIKNANNNNSRGESQDNNPYVELNAPLYDKNIEFNPTNLNNLRNNFFVYFYDVKQVGKRGMSFKLGWINKRNKNIRYTNNQEYTLINMVNDYQQTLYPEIMVNNIKLSDIEINYELLAQKTASEWINNLEELNNGVIQLKHNKNNEVEYQNYSLPANLFKVDQIKKISNNEAYVRFAVTGRTNNKILGNTWYKIKGFALSEINTINENLDFTNENLKTIQESETSIIRERIIEPFWKDLLWDLNKKTNIASWTLEKKYLEKTLLKENSRNRVIKFEILANSLLNIPSKNSRVRNFESAIDIEVSFDKLIEQKTIKIKKSASDGDGGRFNYFVTLNWIESRGVEIKISMEDNTNKIIIDEPEVQRFSNGVTFDKDRAFIILPAAVKTTIKYTNDEEQENFGINQNRFDYKHIEMNSSNQPILFYSDVEFQKDKTVYYPNQNVHYKLHDGYKLNVEYLRVRDWRDWDIVDSAYSRAALVDGNTWFGTLGFLGKVNDDPNDATFYVLTNRHVEGSPNEFSGMLDNNLLQERGNKVFTLAPDRIGNSLERYYDVRTSGELNLGRGGRALTIKLLWSGVEQISKDGSIKNRGQDLTLFVVDLNRKLSDARAAGNMQIAWKIEHLMKKGNVNIDMSYKKGGTMSVPNIREISTLGWPGTQYAGSINRRPVTLGDDGSQSRVVIGAPYFNPYSQIFVGGGASGSGMYIGGDNYIATWTAGASNNTHKASQGYAYDNRNFNFFGVNWDNENPLKLKNYHSIASQIMRANLRFPEKYDLPWFFKEINE